jgi:hypothetical protein
MSNVVKLFDFNECKVGDEEDEEVKVSFDDIMEENRKKKERVEKDRNRANKSVLRSYRIKN